MKKSLAITLLILSSTAVSAGIVLGGLGLYGLILYKVIFASFALFAVHIAAFAFLQRRFKRKYGLSAPKFVLCAAVPPAVTAFAAITVTDVLIGATPSDSVTHILAISDTDIFLMFWLFYAVCFLAVFSVALGAVSAFREWWKREQDLG